MKRSTRKLVALLLSLVLAVSMLAGCGSQKSADGQQSNATAPTLNQANAANENVTNENAQGDAIQKDVINVGIQADLGELSPFGPSNTGRKDALNCFYQPLAHTINGEIVGVLFHDYEIGGTTDKPYLDMFLYDYIYDAAGNHLTANDIKFCLDKGKELGNLPDLYAVESAEVVDEYTIRFNFATELYINDINNVFDNLLIVTQAAYEASPDGMATNPVTTAHYQVVDYTPGYCLNVAKNENYWQTDESLISERDKANVDTINYYILTEPSQMSLALENGSIDMSWSVATDDIDHFTSTDDYWLFQSTDNLCDLLDFNCSEGRATADVNLRTALYYAINQEAIIEAIYGGAAFRMYDCAAMKCPDAQESWATEDNYYQYSVEKAKEYLEAWGGDPASLNLEILCLNDAAQANEAQLIQGFFSAIGVTSTITSYDSAQFNTAMDNGDWDALLFLNASAAYAPNLWKNIMAAENYSWGGTRNFVYDDKLQELIKTARSLSGHSEESVQEAHEYIIENAYAYGVCNFKCNYVVTSDCSSVVCSFKGAVLPGACTYVK